MPKLSEKFLEIYQTHKEKIAAVEQETVAQLVDLLNRIEGVSPSSSSETQAMPNSAFKSLADLESLPASGFVPRTANKIEVMKGDITTLGVDAIVNPASRSLQGGGGIEGAIFARGGSRIVDACRALGGCDRGQAKITKGYDLPAKYVIHTVGPVWKGGDAGEPEMLAACYHNSLELAYDKGIKSIAFPAISTGNFGYPLDQATKVAVTEIKKFIAEHPGIENVYLVGFDDTAVDSFNAALSAAS